MTIEREYYVFEVTIREPITVPDNRDHTMLVRAKTFKGAERKARKRLVRRFGEGALNRDAWWHHTTRRVGKAV